MKTKITLFAVTSFVLLCLVTSCKDTKLVKYDSVLVRIFFQYAFTPKSPPQKIEINIAENTNPKEAKLIVRKELSNCADKNCLNQLLYLQNIKHYFLTRVHSIGQRADVNEITKNEILGEFVNKKSYFYFEFQLPQGFKGNVRAFRLVRIGNEELEVCGYFRHFLWMLT